MADCSVRSNKPRRQWTVEDYEQAFGSVLDATGAKWVRLAPRETITAGDLELAEFEATGAPPATVLDAE